MKPEVALLPGEAQGWPMGAWDACIQGFVREAKVPGCASRGEVLEILFLLSATEYYSQEMREGHPSQEQDREPKPEPS